MSRAYLNFTRKQRFVFAESLRRSVPMWRRCSGEWLPDNQWLKRKFSDTTSNVRTAFQRTRSGHCTSFTTGLCETFHHRRSEEHTSELQSRLHLVCRLLLEKKKNKTCHRPCQTLRRA